MDEAKVNERFSNLEAKCKDNSDFHTRLKSRLDIVLSATLPGMNQNISLLRNDMERQKHQSTEMMIQVKNNANENDEISKHLKKLSAFCSEFSQIKEDAKSFGEKLQKHEMKMHNEIEEIKKQIKNLDASIKSLSTENMKIGKNLSDFKSHSDECQKNMSKDTCESLLDLKKQVENKLENVQMPHFNALEKEKKLIYDALSASNDKMHNILLDLENSLLKSGNNEMQLKIFEKKLENIYLLIKKYEMQ